MPQPPQLAGLLVVLVQTAGSPHSSVFAGQLHTPPVQARPPVQAIPQPPQLFGSVSVAMQAPAHSVSPAAQLAAQAPCEQTSPVAQAVAHLPQWAGSVASETQTPLQRSRPAGQAQAACAQVWPPLHFVPQVPQLLASELTLTHAPPHICC